MASSRFGKGRANDGDWICPDEKCANLNFARRAQCNRCGTDKPFNRPGKKGGIEIGKAAAEKSRGLFSADDWQCPKCGNVNWARRSTCNVCNAPKTGEEERTGLGGGYNERENVEYVERTESDGEYDEFGRKKKKFRKPDSVGNKSSEEKDEKKEEKKKVEAKEEDDDEEDDEDEEGDGDLSKYDLWGSDEEGEKEDDGEKKEKQNKEDAEKKGTGGGNEPKDRRRPHSSSSDDDEKRSRDKKARGREERRSRSRSRDRNRRN